MVMAQTADIQSLEQARAWAAAAAVPDPEVPCVTVADLGILRAVAH
jgi:ring-1,2-phenylacetyl-CoA epoxidase subunit PaaD